MKKNPLVMHLPFVALLIIKKRQFIIANMDHVYFTLSVNRGAVLSVGVGERCGQASGKPGLQTPVPG